MPDAASLAADLAAATANLDSATANLEGHILRRAKELSARLITEAEQAANEAIQEAQTELQRQQDLVAELRRRVEMRDRRDEGVTDAKVRIASALGEMPYKQWSILAAAVERRLAEDAATIERLQGEKLDAIQGHLVDDVPLPEHEEA